MTIRDSKTANKLITWVKAHPMQATAAATGIAAAAGVTIPAWVWPLVKAILGAL